MTDLIVSRVAHPRHARTAISGNPVRRLAARLMAWEKRTNDARHMRELPDYLLRDIGLARAEIDGAIRCGSRRGR